MSPAPTSDHRRQLVVSTFGPIRVEQIDKPQKERCNCKSCNHRYQQIFRRFAHDNWLYYRANL